MKKSRLETAVSKDPIRKRLDKVIRVPPAVLDRAVRPVKASRKYVFESFTQADWDEVRVLLPLEYRWLSNEQLTRQACYRRKVGAYSTKAKRNAAACWSEVKRIVRSYWSGEISLEELGDILRKLEPAATSKRDAKSPLVRSRTGR